MKDEKFTIEYLSKVLTKKLESNPQFIEICKFVSQNTSGNIWLIGGAVSRTLASELYNTPGVDCDFDFVTDASLKSPLVVPQGWSVSYRKFGNPTFARGNITVDLWPLSTHSYISENKLSPTIENLFKGVSYTIQAMAYDVKTKKIVGEIGIAALKDRKFAVNNLKIASDEARRKGTTVSERMTQKAKSMDFGVILPE